MERRDVLKMLTAAPFLGLSRTRGRALAQLPSSAESDPAWRVFESPFLSEIAFPLGGIGTGTVSLGGRGQLRDWEILNKPDAGRDLPNSFFALWHRSEGREPATRILESRLEPPFRGAFGIPRSGLPGMPRFQSARFYGSYPFARLELEDPEVPLEVTLETFNPFIPGNDVDSGLPVAIFYWHLKNPSRARVEATVMASCSNAAGGFEELGGNVNRYVAARELEGIHMTTIRVEPGAPEFGSLALAAVGEPTTYRTHWPRGEWFDAQSLFWDDFMRDGRLEPGPEEGPSPEGKTDVGSIGRLVSLAPGEETTVGFLLAWHFPNRQNYWVHEIFGYEPDATGPIIGNFYASRFGDAWEVARYAASELERLEGETRRFHEALFATTADPVVLDAVSSQMSILRTNTCFRAADGNFYAFEGTGDDHGCCPLNCTHVWNYEQALAHLFPALERTMREVDFAHNTDDAGFMVFRTRVPLDANDRWDFPHAAADGQMGSLVKLYREWQLSGDLEMVRRLWPKAKMALEFAWRDWDRDRDGVMEGVQHNTYDIEFRGPNPMMGAIYLTALRCASEMARALSDPSAATYETLARRGSELLDRETWNGEFYVQAYERAREEKYQVGAGCLSDQLLGQWMAHVVGLGYVLPEEKVRSAIRAVYRYNFKDTLRDHQNPQRIFALGDEGGLLLCTWPRGNRPLLPFVYSDEVWTGIEYQVAAHLIYEGDVEEGVRVVRAVRNRYDGERRNPWNEVECGNHYARALASWSLLTALSGFRYSAPGRSMAFAPKGDARRFASFWSAGPGWGLYEQERSEGALDATLHFLYGDGLELERLTLPGGAVSASAELGDRAVAAEVAADGSLRFPETVRLAPGDALRLRLVLGA